MEDVGEWRRLQSEAREQGKGEEEAENKIQKHEELQRASVLFGHTTRALHEAGCCGA